MTEQQKNELIAQIWQIHGKVEQAYIDDPATKADPQWSEKQRLLLADMATHLLITALNPDEIDIDKLTNNLHSILTITDQFLPDAELKKAAEKLWQ